MTNRVRYLAPLFALYLAGCPTTPGPDPVTQSGSRGYACPVIPTQIGSCSDFHVMNAAMSCGGDGAMQVAVSGTPGGATRFVVQLLNGSRFQGSLIHNDPPCNITNGTDADFTFGAVYTGDQGVEADGTTPCIVQSKLEFSSFNFDLILMAPHEGLVKAKLHETFDKEIINTVFQADGKPPLVGRCARWREWRLCGNSVVETGETCDDGNTADGDGCNATCTGA